MFKISREPKIIIIAVSVIILFFIVVSFLPAKEITGCGLFSNGESCETCRCKGISFLLGTPPAPICLGLANCQRNFSPYQH